MDWVNLLAISIIFGFIIAVMSSFLQHVKQAIIEMKEKVTENKVEIMKQFKQLELNNWENMKVVREQLYEALKESEDDEEEYIPGHVYYGSVEDKNKGVYSNIFYCYKDVGDLYLVSTEDAVFKVKDSQINIEDITSDKQVKTLKEIEEREEREYQEIKLRNKLEDRK
jgi:hypothetical protein